MVENEVTIDGKNVNVTAWGFLAMMQHKRRFLSLLSGAAPHIVGMIEDLDYEDIEGSDVNISELVNIVSKLVEALDEKELNWFIKTVLSQARVENMDMSDQLNWDLVLTANSSLFYKIVLHVMKVNFGDFFAMLQTHTDSVA